MAKRMKEKSAKRLETRDTRPTATARYVRMGAPKAKRVLDIIKNKPAVEACAILDITPSTASLAVKKFCVRLWLMQKTIWVLTKTNLLLLKLMLTKHHLLKEYLLEVGVVLIQL